MEWQQQWAAAVKDTGSRLNLAGGSTRTSFRSLSLVNAQLSPGSGTSSVSRQLPHCSQALCGSRALEEEKEEEKDFAGWDLTITKLSRQQGHALGGSQEGHTAGKSFQPLAGERRQRRADTREPVCTGKVYSHH